MTFNVHHTTAQHAFYTYTKVTVTTCKGAPYVCEYRNFLLSALLSSPSSPLVSPLSFLSSLPPLSYPCSPFQLIQDCVNYCFAYTLHMFTNNLGNIRIFLGKYLKCFNSNLAFFKTKNYFAPLIHGSVVPSKNSEYRLLS